jgi:competence protein ComEC
LLPADLKSMAYHGFDTLREFMDPPTDAKPLASGLWSAWRQDCRERLGRFFRQAPLASMFIPVAIGVVVQQVAAWPAWVWWIAAGLAGLAGWRARQLSPRWPAYLWLAPLFAAIGGTQHAWLQRALEVDTTKNMAGDRWEPVVMECVVDGIPRWRPDLLSLRDRGNQDRLGTEPVLGEGPAWQTLMEIRLYQVRDHQSWREAHGRMPLTVEGRIRDLLPGDRLRVYGKWQRIPGATNPGQFDLASYYERRGQFLRVRVDSGKQVQRLEGSLSWRLDRLLARLMCLGDIAIHRFVHRDQATLASALVLGQREQVEWELQESLLATGTMHMLAISGMHVEMLAISILTMCLLLHVPRKGTILTIGVTVVCYGILCGGQPPVVRAMVLVVCVCIARWFGQPTQAYNLLALAALVVFLQRSSNLFDIGTQLSFLAVAVLCGLSGARWSRVAESPLMTSDGPGATTGGDGADQAWDAWLSRVRPWWQRWAWSAMASMWELAKVSAWVWLITAPLVLSWFHVVSPVAIVLNVVLWIPLLVALLSGLGILLFGTWLGPVGWLLGCICSGALWILQTTIGLAEKIPAGHLWIAAPPWEWTAAFYIGLGLIWILFGFRPARRRWILVALLAWMAAGLGPGLLGPRGKCPLAPSTRTQGLCVTWIDVGHGTSVLIETPGGKAWLYDAGRMGDPDRSYMSIASVLWYQRWSRLDGVFLSHADSDHYNALEGIAKRFKPGVLATTSLVASHSSPALRRALDSMERAGTELQIWSLGGLATLDGVQFRCVHPPAQPGPGSDNAHSLCLMLEYGGRKILLPGDLESPGTEQLTSLPPEHVDVLMAPHHGSLSKSPASLLQWCQPDIVAISGSERASDRRVLSAFDSERRRVLVTARDGAIRLEVDAEGAYRVLCWNGNQWHESRELIEYIEDRR